MYRRAADRELAGDLGGTDTGSTELLHFIGLGPRGWRSALVFAFGLGLGDADQHPLFNQLPLELAMAPSMLNISLPVGVVVSMA